ncbi:I78 family peptidase inhibitor [Sphingobium baderi]|uniref:I78 family peptidase inhibitor n=1 Tax=Sphingobium baderi TaxID=1332080 RepID=UPI0009E8BA74|nr:I78 family peptidase inhibitor [Sphingobium baderi]
MRFAMMAMLLPLAACAGAGGEGPANPPPVAEGPCRNDPVAGFVGQTATADLGAQMLAASGAKTLRWGGPNTAMTMDFRPDRLTVIYDEKMVIGSARCG